MDVHKILFLSLLLALFGGIAVALLPALLGLALGGPAVAAELGGLIFVFAFLGLFVVFFVLGLVWSLISRRTQYLLIAVALVLGFLLLQPELDLLGLAGAVYTLMGVQKGVLRA